LSELIGNGALIKTDSVAPAGTIELRVKSDPHSPSYYRVNGVVPNVDAFYETFDVKEGDGHYLASEDRVRIWR
jgi:predicted metalloendopeptidase